MKVCSKCKSPKDLINFPKNKTAKDGYHHYCKPCSRLSQNSKYNYNISRVRRLQASYNLTLEDLNSLFISQNQKCAICNEKHEGVSIYSGLHIDHSHKTGKVRGLLCKNCNHLIGEAKESIEILLSAINYIKKHS